MTASESSAEPVALRDPDVRLMLEVRAGSATAFEEIVRRYQGRLVLVLSHMIGSRDLAEDLAQDTFLRVFRARHSYQPTAKFSTWLFTIANNVALNALRDSRLRAVSVTTGPGASSQLTLDVLAQASSGQMPARRLDRAELREIVHLALGALSERQRMAVLLNKFEEMSYDDIARTMGLSAKAVKSLLARARVNLREILTPYLANGDAIVAAEVDSPQDHADRGPGHA